MKGKQIVEGRSYVDSSGKPHPINVPSKPNEHLIERIKSLLKDAESGELLGLAYVCQWKGDSVSSGWSLANMHARKLIGEIEFMKRDMMEGIE